MFGIRAIIFSARIVKDGEEPHYLDNGPIAGGDIESVPFHASPVIRSVNRIKVALKLFGDVIPYCIEVNGGVVSHMLYFTRPTIKLLGPGSLIRCTSLSPAAFIQPVYSASV